MKIWGIAIAAAVALSAPAQAQTAEQPVLLTGSVQLVQKVDNAGKSEVRLVEPKVVVPGNQLVFTTAYRNNGGEVVRNFVVTNPLPSAVVISDEDAAQLLVSVDGGKTWGKLAALQVAGADGQRRPAAAADVTHVRWVIQEIAAGASGAVTYHATVR